jgi:hypothetical protein
MELIVSNAGAQTCQRDVDMIHSGVEPIAEPCEKDRTEGCCNIFRVEMASRLSLVGARRDDVMTRERQHYSNQTVQAREELDLPLRWLEMQPSPLPHKSLRAGQHSGAVSPCHNAALALRRTACSCTIASRTAVDGAGCCTRFE